MSKRPQCSGLGGKGMISQVCVFDAEGNEPLQFKDVQEVFFINEETHSSAVKLADTDEASHCLFVNAKLALAVSLN